MFSAVTYPQPSPPPPPRPSIKEMAAAGYFRAIALWLNEPLAPQGLFVQVQTDRPGCLKLLVEFERPPIKERLLRFLCHRVWVLNSELIEGIHVVARPVGRRRIVWHKRIRIVTPALKRRKAAVQVAYPAKQSSPLPPQIREKVAYLSNQHLKTLRSLLLTGSAVAAFMFGCLLEVFTSGTAPKLPSFSAQSAQPTQIESIDSAVQNSPAPVNALEATTIDYRAAAAKASDQPGTSGAAVTPRSTVVDAALEPVGVIQHHVARDSAADDVTLLFGGDVALEEIAYDQLPEAGGLFTEVEDYLQADLSMITLASPLATAATTLEEELHNRNRPDAVNLLADSGIDIVNLTNDSLMEYGTQGLDETLKALDSKGLYRLGAGRNETEARRPEVIDVKGKRIAYLSYSMGGDRSAFNERAGTNAQDMKEIIEDIQSLRDQVDWIVVNYRWMDFITKEPNFKQTNLARLAIDQGADVVVGYHPDVMQGAEVYKGRPIAYSVGDFVFETDRPIADQDAAMLKVSLKQDQMKVEFVPVRVEDSLPQTLEGSEGKAVLQKIEQASQQFETPMQSPMVLDLKDKAPIVPQDYDPDSPFVSPEEADTLPVEPASPVEAAGSDRLDPDEADGPSGPNADHKDDDKPAPEVLDLMEQIDENLLEWGPKPSDGQRDFKPIPQDLQDANGNEVDALLQPGLLRQLQPSSQSPNLNSQAPDESASTENLPMGSVPEPAVAESALVPAGSTTELVSAITAPEPTAEATAEPTIHRSESLVGSLGTIKKAQPKHPEQQVGSPLLSQLKSDPELSDWPDGKSSPGANTP